MVFIDLSEGKSNAKRRSILHYEQTYGDICIVYLKGTFLFLPAVSNVYNDVMMYVT